MESHLEEEERKQKQAQMRTQSGISIFFTKHGALNIYFAAWIS